MRRMLDVDIPGKIIRGRPNLRWFIAVIWDEHRRVSGTQLVCYLGLALFHALHV